LARAEKNSGPQRTADISSDYNTTITSLNCAHIFVSVASFTSPSTTFSRSLQSAAASAFLPKARRSVHYASIPLTLLISSRSCDRPVYPLPLHCLALPTLPLFFSPKPEPHLLHFPVALSDSSSSVYTFPRRRLSLHTICDRNI